ncbi:MAG: glycosyltransferase [Candidatus Anstonellales archaeon]
MRIAFFIDNFLDQNPYSESIAQLKDFCEKNGHKVILFTTTDMDEKSAKKMKDEKYGKDASIFIFKANYIKGYPQFRFSISPFLSAKKLLKEAGCDIIHNFSLGALGMAAATFKKDLKLPGVMTIFELLHYFKIKTSKADELISDIVLKYMKWLESRFDIIHYPSFFAMNELMPLLGKGEVIYLPIPKLPDNDLNEKDDSEKIERHKKEKNGHGNNSKDNNSNFNINNEREIAYIGQVSNKVEIEKIKSMSDAIKNKLGKEIKILNIGNGKNDVRYNERHHYYKNLLVYVEPRNYFEYLFYSVECLCLGKPVVCHKNSATAEFLKKIECENLAYEDESFLSDAILRAIESKDKIKKGSAIIKKTLDENKKMFLKTYEGLFASKS